MHPLFVYTPNASGDQSRHPDTHQSGAEGFVECKESENAYEEVGVYDNKEQYVQTVIGLWFIVLNK
jgi:hypothetical protein